MAQQWPVPTRPFRTAGQRVRTHPEQRGRSRTLRHAHTTVPASRFTYPGRRLNNEPVALYTAATFHLPAGILSLRGRTPVSFWRYPSCQQSPAAHPHSLSAPPSRLMKPRGGLSAKVAVQASNGCGLSHDYYVERFSSEIERHIDRLPENQWAQALQIAQDWDYATPAERQETHDWNAENGYCTRNRAGMLPGRLRFITPH